MKLHQMFLYGLVNNSRAIHHFKEKNGVTVFLSNHQKELWKFLVIKYRDGRNIKYFKITDTTKKRLSNIPIKDITGIKLKDLRNKSGDYGIVFFEDGLHFLYIITKSGFHIVCSRTKSNNKPNDISFYLNRAVRSYIYGNFFIDDLFCNYGDEIDVVLNHKNESALIKEISIKPNLLRILREMEGILPDLNNSDDILSSLKSHPKSSFVKKHIDDWVEMNDDGKLCYRAFLFLYFANVIDITRISEKDTDNEKFDRMRGNKIINNNIIVVDTLYDEKLKVINPFSVTGHFRNQACGKNMEDHKLIYIDEFMKTGYTKQAKKIMENMDAGRFENNFNSK